MGALFNTTVLVAALGYFVDVYDLILFNVVRVPSLRELGYSGEALVTQGLFLLNMQMVGMLVGGIIWGILGDKRGRLSVLFSSIALYSVANAANAYVTNIEAYATLRLLAGIGLAGELGVGITLVAEILPQKMRGFGTSLVAGLGVLGALLAAFVAQHTDWRTAYVIGGAMGIVVLITRMKVFESHLFEATKAQNVARGDFFHLFRPGNLLRYVRAILVGVPIWLIIALPVSLAPEFAVALGVQEPVTAGLALMFAYSGLSLGDVLSGLLSHRLESRKRTVAIFLSFTFLMLLTLVNWPGLTASEYYWICAAMGFGAGYWAMFVTIAAEQYGTNLRATVATTVPNFVRGSVVVVTLAFTWLKPQMGMIHATVLLCGILVVLAFWSLVFLEETYHKDLNFIEPMN